METPFDVPNVPSGNKDPEKYIRTFSGDMETVEKGGTPDLAPLPGSHQTPLERIVAASPVPETPPTAPGEVVLPEVQAEEPMYTPPPAAEAPIETYGADFIDRVKETKASSATVLAAEEDRAPQEGAPESEPSSRNNKFLIAGGIALVLLGGAGAYIAYANYLAAHAPVAAQPTVSAPIFVDDREEISGSGAALMSAIAVSAARPLSSGTLRLLYTSATSTQSVFGLLSASAPDILLRNINVQGSMAGIVNVSGTQSPFFILSVSSYSDTFAGMLSWETIMARNMAALYPAVPLSTATSSAAVSSTTAALSPPSAQSGFRDEVASNHDVRVYRDSAGRSVLLYGYWNPTTLVIARDPSAFAEIVGRLGTSRSQ